MQVERNVFLVDDDNLVCKSVTVFLEACGYLVTTYHSAEMFLEQAECTAEGVILLDLQLTGMSGLGLQAELARRGFDLPIVFITGYGDVRISVEAIKAGASDFLEKPFSNVSLLESISEAFARADAGKMQRDRMAELRKCHASLTQRELEVMKYIVAGMINKDLADVLALSTRTIEGHRSRVMQKMRADSLPDLVRKYEMCQRAGLL